MPTAHREGLPIRERVTAALGLLVLAFAAYQPAIRGGFLDWDDDRYIANNPLWHGPIADYVLAALTRVQFEAYHPLHLLSYLPDRLLWPTWPTGFHLANLTLFTGALFWLWTLVRRHVSSVTAFLAVGLVGLHPLLTESVAWITGRKEILAVVALVAAMWWEEVTQEERRPSILAALFALAAYLTKSATMVLPVLVFALHRWGYKRSMSMAFRRALPSLIPAFLVSVAVYAIWTKHQMVLPTRPFAVFLDVPGTFATYAVRVIWPADLSPCYPETASWHVAGAIAWWLAAGAALLFWTRLPNAGRFGLVVFWGCLLPVSNIVPLYFRFADRYAVFALIALTWPVARTIDWLRLKLGRPALALLIVLICAEAAVTHELSKSWKDSLSLWTRAVAVQPRAQFAHIKLGETLRRQGQWNDAVSAYLAAIRLEPRSLLGYAGLFTALGEGAESLGRVPNGTTALWSQQLTARVANPSAIAELTTQIERAGCPPCARSVSWLSLVLYPRTDEDLVARARSELAADRPEEALVQLLAVHNRSVPGFADVYRQARDRGRYPFRLQ